MRPLRDYSTSLVLRGTLGDVWTHLGPTQAGVEWVEARDAGKPPTRHETALQDKDYLIPNVPAVEAVRPCSG